MASDSDVKQVFDLIDENAIVDLTRKLVAIPTASFDEGKCADFLAEHMKAMGLETTMMTVEHAGGAGKTTRQAVDILRGTGGGKSFMLNGHMDTVPIMSGWECDPFKGKFENGWIWGLGSQDDKGGLAAALAGIAALKKAGVKLAGDLYMCPVAAHKGGGHGTRALLRNGIRTDYAVNIEHSANTIGSVIVGSLVVSIKTTSPGVFFRFTPEIRKAYYNAIEQQALLMSRFGVSLTALPEGGWLRFKKHPELLDFPMLRYDRIHKEHYGRECELSFIIRTVPGMTLESVREDVMAVVNACRKEFPAMDCEVAIPAGGPNDPGLREPSEVPNDHPLVQAIAKGYKQATGEDAAMGSVERIGNVGDGNVLCSAGIPAVQFGPGDIKLYPEWPAPNERVHLGELLTTAKSLMSAAMTLCG